MSDLENVIQMLDELASRISSIENDVATIKSQSAEAMVGEDDGASDATVSSPSAMVALTPPEIPDDVSLSNMILDDEDEDNGKVSIKGFSEDDEQYVPASEMELDEEATDEEFICRVDGEIGYRALKVAAGAGEKTHAAESDTNITFRESGSNLYVGVYYK